MYLLIQLAKKYKYNKHGKDSQVSCMEEKVRLTAWKKQSSLLHGRDRLTAWKRQSG